MTQSAVSNKCVELELIGLRNQLGSATVLFGRDVPDRNCADWSTEARVPPLAVVRPGDTADVVAAITLCRRLALPMVPQGGMTGQCGGAVAGGPGWVALSLERMVGIEEIDVANATMRVRAGTSLEAVQKAADEVGLMFALDLGARGSCSIGGNLSTNAGGNRVIRYGMMRDMVLGLEVVLPDGTVVSAMNKMIKNNAGYDLKQLFIGSEGTLGIVTRMVLRLFPKPSHVMAAICGVEDYAAVLRVLALARQELGPMLSAFEVMWPDYWSAVTTKLQVRTPFPSGHGVYILMEIHGFSETVNTEWFLKWLERLLASGDVSDAVVSQSISDTLAFWKLRDAAGDISQVVGPTLAYDIGLPIGCIGDYVAACRCALGDAMPGCESVYYGHIGDGNLHVMVWQPGGYRGEQSKDQVDLIVYGLVRRFGGSISAEHGIGMSKRQWLSYSRSEAELALMRTVKAALDPAGLLNPGKVIA